MCACAAARGSDSREGEAAHAEEGRKSPLRIAARAHDRRAEGGGEGAPTEDSGCARARRRVARVVWSRAPELAGGRSHELVARARLNLARVSRSVWTVSPNYLVKTSLGRATVRWFFSQNSLVFTGASREHAGVTSWALLLSRDGAPHFEPDRPTYPPDRLRLRLVAGQRELGHVRGPRARPKRRHLGRCREAVGARHAVDGADGLGGGRAARRGSHGGGHAGGTGAPAGAAQRPRRALPRSAARCRDAHPLRRQQRVHRLDPRRARAG
eukprot:scaffold16730_cov66-Phaeocystis_antarctica.AAC.6